MQKPVEIGRLFLIVFLIYVTFAKDTAASSETCNSGAKINTDKILSYLGGRKYLLIGEGHGRREMRPIMEEIFCKMARQNKTVLYATEYPPDLEKDFILFVNKITSANAEKLKLNPIWQLPPDGTTSIDRFMLFQYLRTLNASKNKIFFKGIGAPQNYHIFSREFYPDYETIMYHNLLSWSESLPFDHVVLQAGSQHVRLNKHRDFGREILPVGARLPRNNTLSIRIDAYKGSSWSFQKHEDGSPDIGAHTFLKEELANLPKNRFLEQPPGSDYHAIFILDEVTSSPPAANYFR